METTSLQAIIYFFNMLLAGGGKGVALSTTKILALKLGIDGKDITDLLKEQYKQHFGEDISKVIDKDFELMLYEVAKYHFRNAD